MPKGAWESRVGLLLARFPMHYKPVDTPLHGGAVRIDYHACDNFGVYWLIEVKQVDEDAKSINLMTEVSPLQRRMLDDVAHAEQSIPVLAVGQGDVLYLWGWRKATWLWEQRAKRGELKPHLLPLLTASFILHWTGPKRWKENDIIQLLSFQDDEIGTVWPGDRVEEELTRQTPTVYSPLWQGPVPYALMSKRVGYILIQGRMLRWGPLSRGAGAKILSFANTRTGGTRR